VILNYGAIIANAYGGPGGNITITADQFIKDTKSVINASSEKNVDGEININAPDTDIAGSIAVLPESYIDAASLLKNRCESRTKENTSRLVNTGLGKASQSPDESFPSSFYQKQKNTETSESPVKREIKQKTPRRIFKNKKESSK